MDDSSGNGILHLVPRPQPVLPAVIDILELLLECARRGQIAQLAVVTIGSAGCPNKGLWTAPTSPDETALLVGQLGIVQARIASAVSFGG